MGKTKDTTPERAAITEPTDLAPGNVTFLRGQPVWVGKRTYILPVGLTAEWQPKGGPNDERVAAAMRQYNEETIRLALPYLTPADRDVLDEIVQEGRYWLHVDADLLVYFRPDEQEVQALPRKRGPDGATWKQKVALNEAYEDLKAREPAMTIATFVAHPRAQRIFPCSATTFNRIRADVKRKRPDRETREN